MGFLEPILLFQCDFLPCPLELAFHFLNMCDLFLGQNFHTMDASFSAQTFLANMAIVITLIPDNGTDLKGRTVGVTLRHMEDPSSKATIHSYTGTLMVLILV